MRCEKGAIKENLRDIADYIVEADMKGVDIIGFPEMSITGYADPAKYPEAVIRLDGPEIDSLLKKTRNRKITVLAGLIEENPTGKPFITQAIIHDGKILGYYRKMTIKDEEDDWFSPGKTISTFSHDHLTFGIAICADIDNEEVFATCARQGARIVFELAAPGLYGEQSTRDWQSGFKWWEGECEKYLKVYSRKYNIWIAVATQTGRTIDEDFPGGGYVFAPDGQRVYTTPDWSAGALYLTLDLITKEVNIL